MEIIEVSSLNVETYEEWDDFFLSLKNIHEGGKVSFVKNSIFNSQKLSIDDISDIKNKYKDFIIKSGYSRHFSMFC